MKLLLISVKSNKPVGGIAVWTDHYLSRCGDHGIDCHLVNTEVSTRQKGNRLLRYFGECARTIRIFSRLFKAFKDGPYDIAHLNSSCGPFGLYRDYIIIKYLAHRGVPVAVHYHCDIPFWVRTKTRVKFLKGIASTAKYNMVLCENSRLFLANIGINAVKVPNFIDESIIKTDPKPINDTLSRIFFVGRVSINKGAAELYKLAHRFPDISFVLAGEPIAPVINWKVPDNLHLLGPISHTEVINNLDKSDLFLFPSHSEGFSLALVEAMARGVPCLAFDNVGANVDMLSNGCGITVPIGDLKAMEQAICQLENPEVRKEISAKAIQKVRNSYTADAVLNLFKSVYTSNEV